MTATTWLWSGLPWPHWLVQHVLSGVVGWTVGGLVLATAWLYLRRTARRAKAWAERWLDPHTPGGVGDIPDAEGVKAHERLARAAKSAPARDLPA